MVLVDVSRGGEFEAMHGDDTWRCRIHHVSAEATLMYPVVAMPGVCPLLDGNNLYIRLVRKFYELQKR